MKKRILEIAIIIFSFCMINIYAGGTGEDTYWGYESTNTTNPYFYYDLDTNTINSVIFECGSTRRNEQMKVTISSSDNFFFIHEDNPTQKTQFSLGYTERKSTRTWEYIVGFIPKYSYGNWNRTSTVKQIQNNEFSFIFPQASISNFLGIGTSNSETVSYTDLSLHISIPPNNSIEPGIYKTRFIITMEDSTNNSADLYSTYNITLQAKYRSNTAQPDGFTDFILSIEPTANSYNLDIINNTDYVPIANFDIAYIETSNTAPSWADNQANKYVTLGISAAGSNGQSTSWTSYTNEPYKFKRIGSEYQPENEYRNMITYSLKVAGDIGTSLDASQQGAISNPSGVSSGRIEITVPHTVKNSSMGTTQFRNEFRFSGTASIKINGTNVDRETLQEGRYLTNIYFYVITNR